MFTERADIRQHKPYEQYYVAIPAPYIASYMEKDETLHEFKPLICQPTPEGLALMVKDFRKRHPECDLRLEDQRPDGGTGATVFPRFKALAEAMHRNEDRYTPQDSHPVGLILSHGQYHAIPVFLARQDGHKYMFIFDSTSGGTKFGYGKVADLFPDYRVMLNNGTRQADGQSCISDAFEITTRAFSVDNLVSKITGKVMDRETLAKERAANTGNSRLRILRTSAKAPPDNFDIFRMPEELCFTAQNTKFIVDHSRASLHKEIVGPDGKRTTLDRFLKETKARAMFLQRREVDSPSDAERTAQLQHVFRSINPYLHLKSWQHAETIRRLVIPDDAETRRME